jgi:hypothetical protein
LLAGKINHFSFSQDEKNPVEGVEQKTRLPEQAGWCSLNK